MRSFFCFAATVDAAAARRRAQFLDEQEARPVQSRANRSDGAIKDDGGLRVTQFVQIAEHQRFAVMRGQSGNRRVQLLDHFLAREVGEQIVGVDNGFGGGRRIFFFAFARERHVGFISFKTPQHVMARDAVEIRRERAARRIVIQFFNANERHKNFLRDILCDYSGAAHVQGVTINARLPATVKQDERGFVSGQRAPQQIIIGNIFGNNHRRFSRNEARAYIELTQVIRPARTKSSRKFWQEN